LAFGIATASLPPAIPGSAYGPVSLLSGGSKPGSTLKWTKAAPLPKGLKLLRTGVLIGTPSPKLPAETFGISVKVTQTVISLVGGKRVKTKTTVLATIPLRIT
jgi:hypothetical protein